MLADASPAQLQGRGDLADLYRLMLEGNGARGIVRVIEAVAAADGSVLVHCTAGKDRTGVSVALLLTLVGIDRAAVVTDYVATAANMPGVLARMIAMFSGADAAFVPTYDAAKLPAAALDAPARAIETVLDIWDATPGGAEGWFVAAVDGRGGRGGRSHLAAAGPRERGPDQRHGSHHGDSQGGPVIVHRAARGQVGERVRE